MPKIVILHQQTSELGHRSVEDIIWKFSRSITHDSPDILVGPEYLFCNPNRLYTQEDKAEIVRHLEAITEDSDTVLIPGSIVWRNGSTYKNTVPVIYHGRTIREIEKLSARGIDRGFCGNGVQCIDHSELRGRHAVGHRFDSYIEAHMITIDGVDYFVEICDDHAYIAENKRLSIPKIAHRQIIVSCEQYDHFETVPERLFLKERGLLVECNGDKPTSFVGVLNNGKVQPVYTSESPAKEGIVYVEISTS